MKNIIKFRPLFLAFISVICAGLLAPKIFALPLSVRLTIYFSVFMLLGCSLLLALVLKSEKLKQIFKVSFVLISAASIFVFALFVSIINFAPDKYSDKNYVFTAQVGENSTKSRLYLEKVLLEDDGKMQKLESKIIAYNYTDYEFSVGDYITFESTLAVNKILENGEINSYVARYGFGYRTYLYGGTTIDFVKHSLSVNQTVRLKVQEMYQKAYSSTNAELAYACIFGDVSGLDANIKTNFSISGVVHLLSVSGSHVSIITIAISYILYKKFKIKKEINFAVVVTVLLFYCYLCSFVPSAVRSAIMAMTLSLSLVVYRKSDALSSLSFAGLILLFCMPLNLFDLGFALSFFSAFGIICLSSPLSKILRKRLPDFLASPLAVCLSAQIIIIPFLCNVFHEFPTYFLLANLIILPLFSIVFIAQIISTIIVGVLPFLSFIFAVTDFGFGLITNLVSTIAALPFALIKTIAVGTLATILTFILVFVLSRYVLLKIKTKAIISFAIAVLLIISIIIYNIPTQITNNSIIFFDRSPSFLISNSNQNILFINDNDINITITNLSKQKIFNIDCVIVPYADESVVCFAEKYNCDISSYASFSGGNYVDFDGILVSGFSSYINNKAIMINNGMQILLVLDSLSQNDINVISQQVINDFDVVIDFSQYRNDFDSLNPKSILIYNYSVKKSMEYNFNYTKAFTIVQKSDKILIG